MTRKVLVNDESLVNILEHAFDELEIGSTKVKLVSIPLTSFTDVPIMLIGMVKLQLLVGNFHLMHWRKLCS